MLSWLFVLGAVVGSFLNVCVHRIPQHETLGRQLKGLYSPPSRCPNCYRPILRRDNVPILGWLLLRGRCRGCAAPISVRYPLIELLNGLLFVLVYWFEIPLEWAAQGYDPLHTEFALPRAAFWSPQALLHWRYAYHMILVEALLVASLIDIDLMLIPDATTVPPAIAAIVIATLVPHVHLVPVWFSNPQQVQSFAILLPDALREWIAPESPGWSETTLSVPAWIARHPHWHGLAASLAGVGGGGGVVWAVRIIGTRVLRQEAMGFGDVTLMAMVGAFLGWQAAVVVFLIAPAFALLVVSMSWMVKYHRTIPFGPYLSLGAVTMVLWWQPVWGHMKPFFQLGPLVLLLGAVGSFLLAVCLYVVQGLKWILGIPLGPGPQAPDFTTFRSADVLQYLASENIDTQQAPNRANNWSGVRAARGTQQAHLWRTGIGPARHPAAQRRGRR